MCSSDVIAAVSILKYEEYPKLYSLVFGEGITNDAVSIILFQAIDELDESNQEFTFVTFLSILGNFVELTIVSLVIGLFFGLLASYLLK